MDSKVEDLMQMSKKFFEKGKYISISREMPSSPEGYFELYNKDCVVCIDYFKSKLNLTLGGGREYRDFEKYTITQDENCNLHITEFI